MSDSAANSSTAVRHLNIDAERDGQRIDNYLITLLKGLPRSGVYRILRTGQVRVNKRRVKPDYRLREGDVVRVPPVRLAERGPSARPGDAVLHAIEQSIIYEDKVLLALNKPSGLAVHGGSGLSYGVIEGLRALRPDAPYLELVHRLDRETSGCLLIAKKRSALRSLHEMLREGQVDKRYLALVKGRWKGGERKVTARLRKNLQCSGERMVRVSEDGKPAVSEFRPLERFARASLMEVELHTGRTHQIRVHGQYCGHPLAGDEKYGDAGFNREMRGLGLRRLFLHAARLGFDHPRTGFRVNLEAELPPDLSAVLEVLRGA